MGSLVDGVDHVYVPMSEASAGFEALSEQSGLPVLWPFTSFGTFSSGGVSVGSIKLEVIEDNAVAPWSSAQDSPQIQGVAFRPSRHIDEGFLAEVDARGIPRTAPTRFEVEGQLRWVNVYFSDLISETAGAFVCDYRVPEPRDLEKRRRVLAECGGGRLGVLDAVELVISTRDADAARRRWQRLFDPLRPAEMLKWRPAVGPAVRMVEGEDERVDHLVLAVRSPETAARVWREAYGTLAAFPLRFVPG
jgi:hypothetical protein